MKVLICGVGKVTRHLLHRLGGNWWITLIDRSSEKLTSLIPAYENIQQALTGDASSPVVLDDAGISDFDYVLALTDNDKVNMAITKHAHARGVNYVLSLVNEQENRDRLQELGARTVMGSALLAKSIHHYLQDPRIKVAPLALGQAEIMELDASHHQSLRGKTVSSFMDENWRLVAILRRDQLLFPDPDLIIESGDRLIIIGGVDVFSSVCGLIECGRPHFPLIYGYGLLLALTPGSDVKAMIAESMHVAQNTQVSHVTVLCSDDDREFVEEELGIWSQTVDFRLQSPEEGVLEGIRELNQKENYGLVMMDPFKSSFFNLLTKTPLISLAHGLPCPLLITRHTHPYERILVPFNATPMAERALEIAADLAKQFQAEVSVIVVEEPEVVRGAQEKEWIEGILDKAREAAHVHKMNFREIVRKGNPVKEVVQEAGRFDLTIIGSTTKEKAIFSPHVGELLAQKIPCSALITAR